MTLVREGEVDPPPIKHKDLEAVMRHELDHVNLEGFTSYHVRQPHAALLTIHACFVPDCLICKRCVTGAPLWCPRCGCVHGWLNVGWLATKVVKKGHGSAIMERLAELAAEAGYGIRGLGAQSRGGYLLMQKLLAKGWTRVHDTYSYWSCTHVLP